MLVARSVRSCLKNVRSLPSQYQRCYHSLSTLNRTTIRKTSSIAHENTVDDTIPINVTHDQIEKFHTDGFVVIPNFLNADELSTIATTYDRFINQEIPIPGKDFCDMAAPDGSQIDPKDFTIVNGMLPRVYYPQWQNNIYERKTATLIRQLFDPSFFKMSIDYDQLLAKKPNQPNAVFQFHQDTAYWPDPSPFNPITATCSLAVDATTIENGCIAYLPRSHLETDLRTHTPLGSSREESHALGIELDEREKDELVYAEVPRGGISVHNERIVHGSLGNHTNGWRRTYVIAYRTVEVIEHERSIGFTHSHNDEQSWDEFREWNQ